jgi:hypothetical protein
MDLQARTEIPAQRAPLVHLVLKGRPAPLVLQVLQGRKEFQESQGRKVRLVVQASSHPGQQRRASGRR